MAVGKRKRRHTAQFKASVVREALRERLTSNQLATRFGVHTSQIAKWKKEAIDQLHELFSIGKDRQEKADEAQTALLYEQIGRLQVELDWLKKKCGDVP